MSNRMRRYIVYYTVLVYSVIIGVFLNSNQQYVPMLAYLYVAPFLLLPMMVKGKNRIDDIYLLLLCLVIFSTRFTHPEMFRQSTVLYSLMFIMGYMLFTKVLPNSKMSFFRFKRLVEVIIFAYFFVLVLQQIGTIMGLPIINGILYKGLKLNALAIEPSHTGQILPILILCHIRMTEKMKGHAIAIKEYYHNNINLFWAATYVLLTCGSVACIWGFLVLGLFFMNKRHILIGLVIIIFFGLILLSLNLPVSIRIRTLLPAILSMDASIIYEVDSSASARIGPYIIYANNFNFFDLNTWLGFGCDYAGEYMTTTLTGGFDGNTYGIGGIVNFMMDYGVVAVALFLICIKRLVGFKNYEFLFYLLVISIIPFNHYILWLYMMIMYATHHYTQKYELSNGGNNC